MILIDSRTGSKELVPYFKPFDMQTELTTLEFGDFCFPGNGPDGSALIGVERKRLGARSNDLIDSMRSGRLSGHQLPGLLDTYTFTYLIVEGVWRIGDTGQLQVPRRTGKNKYAWYDLKHGSRSVLYREVDHYLATLTHHCNIIVHHTDRERDTAAFIASRYKYFNLKEWHQHSSHMEIYAPTPVDRSSMWSRRTPTFEEKIAAQLPGVSKGAFDVAKHFKSGRDMANAEVSDWEKVRVSVKAKGGMKKHKIGKTRAKRIFDAWRGR